MMWWWSGYWPHGPWVFGPFIMIGTMVACGAMMFFMMRGMMGQGGHSSDKRALDILKERFARGEITQTEYEEKRHLLEV